MNLKERKAHILENENWVRKNGKTARPMLKVVWRWRQITRCFLLAGSYSVQVLLHRKVTHLYSYFIIYFLNSSRRKKSYFRRTRTIYSYQVHSFSGVLLLLYYDYEINSAINIVRAWIMNISTTVHAVLRSIAAPPFARQLVGDLGPPSSIAGRPRSLG